MTDVTSAINTFNQDLAQANDVLAKNTLDELDSYYEAEFTKLDSIIDTAQEQLDAVRSTTSAVLAVEQAIINFENSLLALSDAQTNYNVLSIPGFASGGTHTGGWRVVGENGPELEYTPPSHIYNSSQSESLIDIDELVAEVKKLRQDIRTGQAAIAASNNKTAKVLTKWDYDGLPATTV